MTLLADFDGPAAFPLSTTGTLAVSPIGSGTCANALPGGSAGGSALCGSDTNSGPGGASTLTFPGIDFDQYTALTFSAVAFFVTTVNSTFEAQDFFTVSAAGTTIAEFQGVEDGDTIVGINGTSGAIGSTFTDVRIPFAGLGTGDLVFTLDTSALTKHLGVDSISLQPVPLPAGMVLLFAGIDTLGFSPAWDRVTGQRQDPRGASFAWPRGTNP